MNPVPSSAPATPEVPPLAAVPDPAPADLLTQLNEQRALVAKLEAERDRHRANAKDLRAEIARINENPLIFALAEIDAGTVLDDAGKKVADLFDLVQKRSEKGKVVITIAAKPFKAALVYSAEIKVTEPKLEATPAVIYVEDGKLSRHDPRQRELPLGHSRADRRGRGDDYSDEEP